MGKSNQKTVSIYKEPCDKNNLYTAINLSALQEAVSTLSGDGFKMWVYFAKNQNEWRMSLSSKHAEETFKLSKRRYDNAIKELIDNHYLVDVNIDPNDVANLWAFYEKPQEGLVDLKTKPLQQNEISLDNDEIKPCLDDDTRNTTTTTKNTTDNRTKNFDEMSDRERREAFSRLF